MVLHMRRGLRILWRQAWILHVFYRQTKSMHRLIPATLPGKNALHVLFPEAPIRYTTLFSVFDLSGMSIG